jgi:hypothetical protein
VERQVFDGAQVTVLHAIRNDRTGRSRWRTCRRGVEDDSETRAHYPIVESALADGVYDGGSKS